MSRLIIIAVILMLVFHYIAVQLMKSWKEKNGDWKFGLATGLFMINGNYLTFLFIAFTKGGDL